MAEPGDLAGRRFVVTGGNTGLGYFSAEQLAARGAQVLLAARNPAKAAAALASIRARVPGADPTSVRLDLADLASVRDAVRELTAHGPIDGLIANAGLTTATSGDRTADGFELMFGVNHLGHFALVAGVLPLLTERATVVHLGSISHEFFRLDLADPMNRVAFRAFRTYGRSKLAVMTFGFELDRRLRAAGSSVRSIVAHPGLALDSLTPVRPGVTPAERLPAVLGPVLRLAAQGKDAGAGSIVRAATDPAVPGGAYVGPDGWRQLRGAPAVVRAKPWSRDVAVAARLWALSADLTGASPAV